MGGLADGGVLRAELVNRLQELVAENEDGQDVLLFDRLCHLVRDGAGHARKWTRATLLNQLRGVVRLRVAPNYARDIDALQAFSLEGLADVSETIDDFHVARPALQGKINDRLAENRLANISGLPGCGKSAVLKRFASEAAARGSILFLKADRLVGTSWSTYASALGLRHSSAELLAEIGATGTPILFIDGIDRVRPDQKGATGRCSQVRATKDLRPTARGFQRAFIVAPASAMFPSTRSPMTRRRLWQPRSRICGGSRTARQRSGRSPGGPSLQRSWPAAWSRMMQRPKRKLTSMPSGGLALATTHCRKLRHSGSGRCLISRKSACAISARTPPREDSRRAHSLRSHRSRPTS